jgi:hypothetical protein
MKATECNLILTRKQRRKGCAMPFRSAPYHTQNRRCSICCLRVSRQRPWGLGISTLEAFTHAVRIGGSGSGFTHPLTHAWLAHSHSAPN